MFLTMHFRKPQMRSKLYFLFSLLFFVKTVYAVDPNAKNYSCSKLVKDCAIYGDDVWIATWGGAVKFNCITKAVEHFNCTNSGIVSNNVDCIAIDHLGKVFFGQYFEGLSIYDGGSWTFYSACSGGELLKGVSSIVADEHGGAFLIANFERQGVNYNGVIQFSNGVLTVLSNLEETSLFNLNGIAANKDHLWVGTNSGLFHYDGASWVVLDSTNSVLPTKNIKVLGCDTTEALWLVVNTTPAMVAKFDGTNIIYFPDSITGSDAIIASEFNINTFTNKVYFNGRYCSGITDFDGVSWHHTIPYGPNSSVKDFCFDAQGKAYITFVYDEFTIDDGNSQVNYNIDEYPISYNYSRSVATGKNNKKYFSIHYSFYESDGLTIQPFAAPAVFGTKNMLDLDRDKYGNLWVRDGYWDTLQASNVAFYDGAVWTVVPIRAATMSMDPSGAVWFGGPGIKKYDHGIITDYSGVAGVNTLDFSDLAVDTRGDVWIANYYDLVKFDGINLTHYDSTILPILSYNNTIVCADNRGNIWANIDAHSLLKFDGSTFTVYDSASGHPGYSIYDEVTDHLGEVWFGSYSGLVHFDGTDFTLYNQYNSGIGTPFVVDINVDDFNNIWMANDFGGITVFNKDGLSYKSVTEQGPNAIEGYIYKDDNLNGARDSTETRIPSIPVMILPDSLIQFSNQRGKFRFDRDAGSYEIKTNGPQGWTLFSDSSQYMVQLDSVDICCFDFGYNCTNNIDSTIVDITPTTSRCGAQTTYYVRIENRGCIVHDLRVVLFPDSSVPCSLIYPAPLFSNADSIVWIIPGVVPFGVRTFTINGLIPLDIYDTLFTRIVVSDAITGNILTGDTLNQIVTCSYDPNSKEVLPFGVQVNHNTPMNTPLEYTIHFQNLGTDTAYNICIKDTLNALLDFSTLEFVSSDHNPVLSLSSMGLLNILFSNVMLPNASIDSSGSMGFVKYRISPRLGLPNYSRIENTAHIFFDLNPDVMTNTAYNTLVYSTVDVPEVMKNSVVHLYPNPSDGFVKLKEFDRSSRLQKATLIDLSGKTVACVPIFEGTIDFRSAHISSGIYLAKLTDISGAVINRATLVIY